MSVTWPKHIAGDDRYCGEIEIRQVSVAWWCLGQECPGYWNHNQSLDSFLGVGVAFLVSVFAESDVVAVEVSLAFFAASAPFL